MQKPSETFNSISILKDSQYKNSSNLNARMKVHELFSVAKEPWFSWVWRHLDFPESARVLELGAGTGLLWARNLDLLSDEIHVVLTDLSEGMLASAKEFIGDDSRFEYVAVDVDHLNFEDDSFDIIIANHMLYHVPDVQRTLSEVRRLLKPEGVFYAATNGESHMQELYDTMNAFGENISAQKFRLNFVLENGVEYLKAVFSTVDCVDYPNGLHITDVEPLIEYIYSMQSIAITGLGLEHREALTAYYFQMMSETGAIEIRKHAGMFICR